MVRDWGWGRTAPWVSTLILVVNVAAALAANPTTGPSTQPSAGEPRRPIPTGTAIARAEKLVRDVFGPASQIPPERRSEVARKMLGQATESKDDPATRYVLLRDATDLSARAGDAGVAMEGARQLAEAYAVRGADLNLDLLRRTLAASTTPRQAAAVAAESLSLSEAHAHSDQFDLAERFASLAEAAAARASTDAITTAAGANRRELSARKKAATASKLAQARLVKNPNDPEANFTVGYYAAVYAGKWDEGLPLLAKGADAAFKAAAQAELERPEISEKRLAVGDAWWDLADREAGFAQTSLRKHAIASYQRLLDEASLSGLNRVRIDKRVAMLAGTSTQPSAVAGPANTGGAQSLVGPRNRRTVLFRGTAKEEPIFRALSGGALRVINSQDASKALADPGVWSNVGIMVWGVNRFRSIPATDLNERVVAEFKRFVEAGGDLVLFEQYDLGNMHVINDLFAVKPRGGPFSGVAFAAPELEHRSEAVGYSDAMLKEVRFYNGYEVPKDAIILLRDEAGNVATAAVVPFGKGRVILLGTNLSPSDEKLDEVFFGYVYSPAPLKPGITH